MLEFVLFFFGMPLAITLLYNYCEKQKKRKALLKRLEDAKVIERQTELEREQKALAREQMRLAKEQEKQAAILEKHEKRIEAFECKVRKLDRDITATNERVNEYYGQLDWYLLQQSETVSGGKEFRKWQDKIESVTDKIRKAENKIADMKDAKTMAERELSA